MKPLFRYSLTTLVLLIPTCLLADDASSPNVAESDSLRARNDAIIVRAIERMQGYDYRSDPRVQAAIQRQLERSKGTEQYLELARNFRPDGMVQELAKMVTGNTDATVKVGAADLLAAHPEGPKVLRGMLRGEDVVQAAEVATVLGLLGNGRALNMLQEVASNPDRAFDVRKHAVAGLARSRGGEDRLISLAEDGQLVADMRLLAGGLLSRSGNQDIRKRAAKALPQPQQKDREPVAPIDQLASMNGDAEVGQRLFRGVATCANCHIVDEFGKNVGPDLSEIGSKLSREAMFTSILDPSAGISHNYENYVVLTSEGQVITGLKVSETPQHVTIRTAEAIDRKIPVANIEQMKKSETSIMPDNLHLLINQKGLVDIVEYMTTLKKKG